MVKEREAGTLEQLAVMPLRPVDVIVGKIAPYLVLAAIDMVVARAAGLESGTRLTDTGFEIIARASTAAGME